MGITNGTASEKKKAIVALRALKETRRENIKITNDRGCRIEWTKLNNFLVQMEGGGSVAYYWAFYVHLFCIKGYEVNLLRSDVQFIRDFTLQLISQLILFKDLYDSKLQRIRKKYIHVWKYLQRIKYLFPFVSYFF